MEKANEDKKIMREFWSKHKDECCLIRSIDAVYDKYLEYLKEIKMERAINRYIFRTYIRKNGYCNTGIEMKVPIKTPQQKIDKLLRKTEQIKRKNDLQKDEDKIRKINKLLDKVERLRANI